MQIERPVLRFERAHHPFLGAPLQVHGRRELRGFLHFPFWRVGADAVLTSCRFLDREKERFIFYSRFESQVGRDVQGALNMKWIPLLAGACVLASMAGCATENSRVLETKTVAAASSHFAGQKLPISVGKFENRSSFQRGIFSDGVDRLGNQSKTILISHLQQSNRFSVLDRENMSESSQEAKIKGQAQKIKGADFLIAGDVTEFGRKEVGDHQLFGILGRAKEQIAYAKVVLNVVDASSSEVIYSAQGAGEFSLSNREVIGFGGTAGYDATLNGKVLDLAIRQAVDKLAAAADSGAFQMPATR